MTMSESKDLGPKPHAEEARLRFGIAKVALIAGLAAAVLTASGALAGQVLAAHLNAKTQRSDFLRGQQQALYAKIIVDARSMESITSGFAFDATTATSSLDATSRVRKKDEAGVEAAIGRVQLDAYSIQVIGTDPGGKIYNSVLGLIDNAQRIEQDVQILSGTVDKNQFTDQQYSLEKENGYYRRGFPVGLETFIALAHAQITR